MNNAEKKSILFRVGLGRKSGKLIFGTEMVCDGVRDGKVKKIFVAENVSENTGKRIENCAKHYGINTEILSGVTTDELGAAIGKTAVACVGATDDNIAKLIETGLEKE